MKIAIIDERAPEAAERSLAKRGYLVLRPPRSKALPEPISGHPDMLMFTHGGTLVSSGAYVEEAGWFFDDLARLSRLSFRITADTFGEVYPRDCVFNALTIKDTLFAGATVSDAVKQLCRERGLRYVSVKQGYPACTVLGLGSSAVTADKGMALAMRASGIEVTEIENGGISLPPYDYGFIGGAAGVDGDRVFFLGDPETHPSAKALLGAIERAGLRPVSLMPGPLLDLGRIIFAE